jgi:PST family polysaccharide transporter
MVAGVGSRVIQLIGTMILTRFIVPKEYGEISAAQICLTTAGMFVSFAFGQSIIARNANPKVCFHAFVYHIGLGVLAMSVALIAAPYIAPRLDAEAMTRYMPGFALAGLFDRVAYVPERVLLREMHFRSVALTRGLAEITFTGVALLLAPHIGGMAIVWANIVRYSIIMVVLVAVSDRKLWFVPTRLDWKSTVELFSFGAPLTIGFLAEFAASKWDNLLVSRYFGTAIMGLYNLSYNLAVTPTINVAEHIGDVLLPSFARMQTEQRKDALVRAGAIMALVVFPLAAGLAAVAPTAVFTFFEGAWEDMAPMLVILCSLSIFGPLEWSLVAYLQAQSRPRTIMMLSVGKLILLLALIATVGKLGPRWVCASVSFAFAVHFVSMLWAVRLLDGVPIFKYLAGIFPPLLACAPMFAVVTVVRWWLAAHGHREGWTALLLLVFIGAVTYIASALVVARPLAKEVLRLLKAAKG